MDRCPGLFKDMFRVEFAHRFPAGLKIPPNKTRLKVSHRAANGTLAGRVFSLDLDLPDVSVLGSQVGKLQETGEAAAAALDPYSRFIGRYPDQGHSLDAQLLLPKELWPEAFLEPLLALRKGIEAAGRPQVIRLVDLQLSLPEGLEFTKARFIALCRACEKLGIGIEPDVQFGGTVPESQDPIALFKFPDRGGRSEPSATFSGAALVLHLASAVAGSDGDFGDAEARLLLDQIKNGLDLPVDEVRRLEARLELFRRKPPHLTGLKKKIETLGKKARAAIGDFLVQVVHANGVVAPNEVRSLEKVYKLLGLDAASLYSKLHGAASEPVTVRPATAEGPIYRIPPPPVTPGAEPVLRLDMAKVAALKADSEKVSALLGSIFAEPQAEGHQPPVLPEIVTQTLEDEGPLPVLDPEHRGLLQALLHRPQWTRAELEEICSDRGLMVDGAIERINDASFERYDLPMIEGDDPLDIHAELILEETV